VIRAAVIRVAVIRAEVIRAEVIQEGPIPVDLIRDGARLEIVANLRPPTRETKGGAMVRRVTTTILQTKCLQTISIRVPITMWTRGIPPVAITAMEEIAIRKWANVAEPAVGGDSPIVCRLLVRAPVRVVRLVPMGLGRRNAHRAVAL